jgi:ABC-type molybdenum transport system ATPase subunit/photorepair protein PhrA
MNLIAQKMTMTIDSESKAATKAGANGLTFNEGYCLIESVATRNKKNTVPILHTMALVIAVTAILGPRGSGKTTLLQVITDYLPT